MLYRKDIKSSTLSKIVVPESMTNAKGLSNYAILSQTRKSIR